MGFRDSLIAARAGSDDAQRQLFERWRSLLTMQAERALGPQYRSRVSPADIVQETLTQAARELDVFQGDDEGQWVKWLQCLVAGHAAKVRRHHQAEKRSVTREVDIAVHAFSGPSQATPLEQLTRIETAAETARAIEQLPVDMRTAVIQRAFHGQSWRRIAQDLGKSEAAARVLWTRGLRILRSILEESI